MLLPTTESHLSHPKYRPDVDGLRAIAVLAVVFFHAFPSLIRGGFVGVDVFFVISGYLISTIIFENLDRGTFSFSEFYARRIKRIFPALILVLVACFVFGWFVLLADEYKQLGKHIAASAGFISNIIFWNEAGYFDNAQETKPLLHLWSLGIEEQFYILWPLVIWVIWKRKFNLLTITFFLAIASFMLNLKGVQQDAVATFYSPQTRFWELLSGSLLAWTAVYKKLEFAKIINKFDSYLAFNSYKKNQTSDAKFLSNFLSFLGLLLLVYGFWRVNKNLNFPGKWALVPVVGTVLIIAAGSNAFVNRIILSNKILVWFGLISYPLYLWHWPLLSFARIIESEVPSESIRIAAIVVFVILAWFTYKLIELPIRFGKHSNIKIITLLLLMTIIGYVGYNSYKRDGLQFRNIVKENTFTRFLEWSHWDNKNCSEKFNISPCQISNDNPHVMIIGDSHGNHLYPGMVQSLRQDVGVFSGGTCTPALGVKLYVNNNQASHPCAAVDFLSKNLKIIDANPTIKLAILSSFWRPVLDGQIINLKEREYWGGIRLESVHSDEAGLPSDELIYRGLNRTIFELLNRKIDVIFIRDTPDFAKDIREECLKRLSFSFSLNCSLPRVLFESRRAKENILISKLKVDFPTLKIYDPYNVFCDSAKCFLVVDGKPLYRDQHHLSVHGSNLLGKAISDTFLLDWKR